ncbi:MAG: bifunctional DNA primase/polymerase [bacterium]|nr:bifunctional DNA primase/polymerase [bacterium]
MESLLEAAIGYAKLGFPVLPLHSPNGSGSCDCGHTCQSPAKHPRTEHGLHDATLDEPTIRRWWNTWPGANVGIAVPQGYVVLDVDGEEGRMALKASGESLPATALAQTGRGWHHVYKTQVHIPPKAGILRKVDLRGPGSYIVAPPSKHLNGKTYSWIVPLSSVNVSPVPEWIEALAQDQSPQERFDTAKALQGVPDGERDVTLFRLAAKLRYADVPFEMAENLILEAARKCSPAFPEAQAKAKVLSAYGRYQPTVEIGSPESQLTVLGADNLRIILTSQSGPVEFLFSEMEKNSRDLEADLSIRLLLPGTPPEPYIQKLNILSVSAREACRRELDAIHGKEIGWAKILNKAVSLAKTAFLEIDRSVRLEDLTPPKQLEFVIQGIAPDNGATILFGAGSSAKTYLSLSMALAVVRGIPWLDRPTQKRNVLFVDYETGQDTWGYRVSRLLEAYGMTRRDMGGLFYWWGLGIPVLDQVDSLKRCVDSNNIGWMILDHVAAASGTEPEKAESAVKFDRALRRIGLPCLAIAHITGEGERDPGQVKRPFGSVFYQNTARRTWFVQREQEQESDLAEIGFYCRKCNDGRRPADFGVRIQFDGEAGAVWVSRSDLRETPELNSTRGSKYVIRDYLLREGPMDTVGISYGTGIKEGTIRNTLNDSPRIFERRETSVGGRGNKTIWSIKGENSDTEPVPF